MCHNGSEFVRVIVRGEDAEEILEEDYDPLMVRIGCATCHDPHSNQYAGSLRIDSEGQVPIPMSDVDDVPIMISAGVGNICVSCHNGRRDYGDYQSRVVNGSGHFGPHGNPQGAVWVGEMGGELPYGTPTTFDNDHAHMSMAADSCIDCHMWSQPYQDSENPALWGHEMHPSIDACAVCHVGETDLDALMADLRVEYEATMAAFVAAWPADWKDLTDPLDPVLENRDTDPATGVGPARDDPVGNAYRATLWVWYLFGNDGSHAAHNPTFFRDAMAKAQAELEALNAVNFP